MKRLFGIFILVLMSFYVASAATLSYSQIDIAQELEANGNANVMVSTIVPSRSNTDGSLVVFFGNQSIPYDQKYEFAGLSKEVYFYFDNVDENNDWQFLTLSNGLGRTQNVTWNEDGYYYFKLTPEDDNEFMTLYVDIVQPGNATPKTPVVMYTTNLETQGVSTFMNTLANPFVELMTIIGNFWKLIYYLFIVIVILAGLSLIVGAMFLMFEWAERLREKKKKLFKGGD